MNHTVLGALRARGDPRQFRSVKDEIRENLIRRLKRGEPVFPGIVGYEETVVPAVVNALLARHNFILLGLRGQAKSRILRGLVNLLDETVPAIEASEINEDPFFPITSETRRRIEQDGDRLPIRDLTREERYVEKLATPDVTVADLIGDLDPIKAAKSGRDLSDFSNVHFGLLPRANRGIFAVNELPDLAPKIQVALLNIMQEGDIQIKGFPFRLPLDVLLVFSANPEDYTARGKIISPLKDRIGAEIRTHYPQRLEDGVRITQQESWVERNGSESVRIPEFLREIVEAVAFAGRNHTRIDQASGVSQRLPITLLETVVSNAEQRVLRTGEDGATARLSDLYSAIPAVTGKLELTYEGELKGAERIAQELISKSVFEVFQSRCGDFEFDPIVQWFDLGGTVSANDRTPDRDYLRKVEEIQGLGELLNRFGTPVTSDLGHAVSAVEFFFEGLCAHRRLSRSQERGYFREREEAAEKVFGDLSEGRSFS